MHAVMSVTLAMLAAGPAAAAEPLTVTTGMMVEHRVAAPDGTTRIVLERAAHAVPGDHVVVTIDYRNTGRLPIAGLVLANPVPRGLAYRGPAGDSPPPDLSADGQSFAAALPAGVGVVAVRWRLAGVLAPGAGGRLAFAATLK